MKKEYETIIENISKAMNINAKIFINLNETTILKSFSQAEIVELQRAINIVALGLRALIDNVLLIREIPAVKKAIALFDEKEVG